MPGFTKKAIRDSFIKLLNERPVNQITVKDIVEDCGINRNSFYYHYQDMPSMIEEIILDEVNSIIRQYPTIDSLEDCLDVVISFALENRRAALHLYHSSNRDVFEQYLWRVCDYTVKTYFTTVFGECPIRESDRNCIIQYCKWVYFGAAVDWLHGGMRDDVQTIFRRIMQLKKGMPEEMVRRSMEDERSGKI